MSYTKEEDIIHVIMEETESRFSLAREAPISDHPICSELGNFGEKLPAEQLLAGLLPIPADLDKATKAILEEIIQVQWEFDGSRVDTLFSAKLFQEIWQGARESTASSYSGGHFGNYMASEQSEYLSGIYALKLMLIAKCEAPPER